MSPMSPLSPVRVHCNGKPVELPPEATVATLLTQLGFDGRGVAVERNRAVVPRAAWSSTNLSDGDRLEIVGFVGGGA